MRKVFLLFLLLIVCIGNSFSQLLPPSGLNAKIESWGEFKYITLTWNKVENAKGYMIYRNSGDSLWNSFKIPRMMSRDNSFKDKMVIAGKIYSYYVIAYNRNEESQPSDTIQVQIPDSSLSAFVEGYLSDETTGEKITGVVTLFPFMGWHHFKIETDSAGYFSKEVTAGEYYVSFTAKNYYPEFYDNTQNIMRATSVTIPEGQTVDLSAALKPFKIPAKYTLSGNVSDSSGLPVKSEISVFVLNHNFFRRDFLHAVTDSLGNYKVKVREGDSVIVYAAPFRGNYISEFYNDKSEFAEADKILVTGDIENINFVLAGKPVYDNEITGFVKDTDGNGIAANVTIFRIRDQRHPNIKRTVMTDSTGNYSLSNLTPGKYILLTIPQDGFLPTFYKYDGSQTLKWREADSIDITENSKISDINFTVTPIPDSGLGLISGSITDNSGEPVNGAIVFTVDENSDIADYTTSDQNGNYFISNVYPGQYSIVVDKVGFNGSGVNNVNVSYQNNLTQNVALNVTEIATAIENQPEKARVSSYKLSQNYPNPFNPATTINYQVVEPGMVTIKLFNIIGQEVMTILNEYKQPGSYNVKLDAKDLQSGIYLYRLQSGSTTLTRKMTILK